MGATKQWILEQMEQQTEPTDEELFEEALGGEQYPAIVAAMGDGKEAHDKETERNRN